MIATLGLDIGGANLKAAHLDGTACMDAFPLWKQPEQLPAALALLLDKMPAFDVLAVTMTGELCDCFETKRQGVHAILDAVANIADGKEVLVWRTSETSEVSKTSEVCGAFADVNAARQTPLQTAAANWLALAVYAGRFAPQGPALLIDIGSTTTDIIPLQDGNPIPRGLTDTQRLNCQELVYTGVKRTPVCALLGSTVMAELFATTQDVYLALGDLPESQDSDTADSRPATKAYALSRLARMIGGDRESCTDDEILAVARKAAAVQQGVLQCALRRVLRSLSGPPQRIIFSGSGEFLAPRLSQRERFDEKQLMFLSKHLGPGLSTAACAHAVAVLAQERCSHGA